MKKYIALLLILCTVFLCCACSKEKEDPAQGPRIRYEAATAHYTHEGSTYTMDLQFDRTLTPGSKISLLLDEDEILHFTTEAAVSRLRISSPLLEKNKGYTLKVNGKLQKHGARNLLEDTPRPGDIPDPTQPTIPVEPMGQIQTAPSVSTEGTEPTKTTESPIVPESSFSLENPPTITIESEIPSLIPVETTENGLLPSESFKPGQGEENNDITIRPAPQSAGTVFTLTETVTEFTSVGDAD